MELSTCDNIANIPASEWNTLAGHDNPFIQHDFLLALEQHDCLHEYGWYPKHLLIKENDRLVAAAPAYVKTNSYGELVFDWSWADAYQQAGLNYYPKLVTAIPYTPATGPRYLVHPDYDQTLLIKLLIEFSIQIAHELKLSSIHNLFLENTQVEYFAEQNFILRNDVQFHWHNDNYRNFDDFLSRLKQKKKKNIRQERRKVQQAGIKVECIEGNDLSDTQWTRLYDFYRVTFMKKSGSPTLSLNFFKAIKHKLLAIIAFDHDDMVAGAICIKAENALYGRHWGCFKNYDSLHFEVCYYQGIEYCIRNKVALFEPGAQGEHKLARGFMPTLTWSSHWLAHDEFYKIIAAHCQRERTYMQQYYKDLLTSSPYNEKK